MAYNIQPISLEQTIAAMRGGGDRTANAIEAGQAGVAQSQAAELEKRKAALAQRIQEAGLIKGSELGLANVEPQRELTPAVAELFVKQNTPPKPPAPGMAPLSPEGQKRILDNLPNDSQRAALEEPLRTIAAKDVANLFSRNYLPLTVQEKAPDTAGRTEAIKGFNLARRDATKATNSLAVVEKMSKELGDFKTGALNQVVAKVGMDIKKIQADPTVVKYLAAVDQQLGSLARGPFAERGVLTDDDVLRVKTALGMPTLPLKTKLELLDMLSGKMYADMAEIADQAGRTSESDRYRKMSAQKMHGRDPLDEIPAAEQPQGAPSAPQQVSGAEPTLADIDAEIARRKAAKGGR